MPRVTEAHREARRAQIRAAALRAFSAKGYQRASISDVVAESGLSAGAIYGHYDGKQALFAAVAEEVLSRRSTEIDAAGGDGVPPSPIEVLTILTGGMTRDLEDGKVLVQLWAESTVDPVIHDVVQHVVVDLRNVLTAALQAWFGARPDVAPDGPDAAARLLLPVMLGLGQGFLVQRALLDDFDGARYLEAAAAVLPS
ncbi:TetR/AcrR family transcriptional regulator [Krasilnikoviella flava]|uniref:Transcriptional regulator, TetR family n=1 Tax=Krasilnikoviella flava TaxID=526729 RepID=A0A1T5LSN3_9MICO|nr:TetR/AcrR family transcriptional regulator [Krasilnikoviella flava]SKC78940.1 transcriptional regulator, TetR family [Krasilnikoviella flava]